VTRRLRRSPLALAALLAVALAVVASSAAARQVRTGSTPSHQLLLGLMDDAMLINEPDIAFTDLQKLHPQIIRFDADWPSIAMRQPSNARDPNDPAYDFSQVDSVVKRAAAEGIPVMLTIAHTPAWDGGTLKHNHMPRRILDLQNFAYAIATRYSGHFADSDGNPLPAVTRWEAWNEPNTATHLSPQFACHNGRGPFCKGGTWTAVSPAEYVSLDNAIYRGIHSAGTVYGVRETVAGGATKPTGNGPTSSEPSIAPLRFLRLIGAKHALMDVYSHHPYNLDNSNKPTTGDNLHFDNIAKLFSTLDKYYPGRHMHVWLTEYGKQSNPPDKLFGVSLAAQAANLRASVATSKRYTRIDMLIWFLIRDEVVHGPQYGGFQTGLEFNNGQPKPAAAAFEQLTPLPVVKTTATSQTG
jgi:hypothetical protein